MTTLEVGIPYRIVGNNSIYATITLPLIASLNQCPIIVRWHGGFLVTGNRNYAPWRPAWLLELALSDGAIIVAPDYRLLPEASLNDILDDVSHLWRWMMANLALVPDLVKRGITPDTQRIMVVGESAGGYLAAQTFLLKLCPQQLHITTVVLLYSMLDLGSSWYQESFSKGLNGATPEDILDEHMNDVQEGKRPNFVAAAEPPDRMDLACSIIRYGKLAQMLGSDPRFYPLENISMLRKESVPAVLVVHGVRDSVVPYTDSVSFYNRAKEKIPNLKLILEDGEHGFDVGPWLGEIMAFIRQHW